MKKFVVVIALIAIANPLFSKINESPAFMIESGAGYAVGINLDNAAFFGIRLIYPFERFGFVVETNGMLVQGNLFSHIFIGPMMYFVNSPQWRILLNLGLDVKGRGTTILGIGSTISAHRKLGRALYAGFNLGVVYAFSHIHEVQAGYRTDRVLVEYPPNSGNAIFIDRVIPIYETRNHFGNRLQFRPSLSIGLQF